MATTVANVADLLVRLDTIDANAARKFTAHSQDMIRVRTDEVRRHIANGKPIDYIYSAVIDMRGWAACGSLQSITWLDREIERLAQYLEPASVALVNAHVAALITEGMIEANR